MMSYIVVAVVALVLLIAVAGLRTRSRNRRQLESLATAVEAMRRTATQEITYRPPTPAEAALGDDRGLFEAAQRELDEQRLTVLGDLVEEQPGGVVIGTTRWFVDASRTVTGWFGVVRHRESGAINPTMMVFSESESGDFFLTGRGAVGRVLARPQAVHRAFYPWNEGLARVLQYHVSQTAQASSGGRSALRRVEEIDEAVALLGRLRETGARWRASQPRKALLEEDVRSLLQERFADLGRPLIELMTARGY
jgi:type II secretory pathway pseudopilin PulG